MPSCKENVNDSISQHLRHFVVKPSVCTDCKEAKITTTAEHEFTHLPPMLLFKINYDENAPSFQYPNSLVVPGSEGKTNYMLQGVVFESAKKNIVTKTKKGEVVVNYEYVFKDPLVGNLVHLKGSKSEVVHTILDLPKAVILVYQQLQWANSQLLSMSSAYDLMEKEPSHHLTYKKTSQKLNRVGRNVS